MELMNMAIRRFNDLKTRTFTAEQLKRINDRVQKTLLDMSLREVREMVASKTQVETAELLEKTQGEISTIEHRSDHLVSTLREYVEALGGELEIVATFGDRRVRLRGV